MFELTISGEVYQFNFGMGFLRKINKKVNQPVVGFKDVNKDIGLGYMVLLLIDRDVEALVEVLLASNEGTKRVTQSMIDSYIDNEVEDIEQLFVEVLDFLRQANATKKKTIELMEEAEKALADQKAAK